MLERKKETSNPQIIILRQMGVMGKREGGKKGGREEEEKEKVLRVFLPMIIHRLVGVKKKKREKNFITREKKKIEEI